MKRKAVALVIVLAFLGLGFGLGTLTVMSQNSGSCPSQTAGSQFVCDHAYLINGSTVWMRPLLTGLGIASLVSLASAVVLALYKGFGSKPSTGPPSMAG